MKQSAFAVFWLLVASQFCFSAEAAEARGGIRLYGATAHLTGAARFEGGPKWLVATGQSAIGWTTYVSEEGEYRITVVHASDAPSTAFALAVGSSMLNGTLATQPGVFEDPLINFGRTIVADRVRLGKGPLRVQLEFPKIAGQLRIRSIELLPVDVVADVEGARQRVSTDWLARAAYGVMFHWTSESQPRHGPAASYEEAVKKFDAVSFARMVQETGAAYVIFTVNHAKPHCPAPIASWERIHPGSTTRRDLLADIAKALAAREIRLTLYIASHTLGELGDSSDAQYFQIHADVLSEIGERYGNRVAGYWFDGWYQSSEAYPRIDLRKLIPHVRAGNPSRIVAYNFWVYPVETAWQDYWAGEVGGVVRYAEGRYAQTGSAIGLQNHFLLFADAPWVHSAPNAEMEPLRFSDRDLIDFVRMNAKHHVPVTINLGIYQDGTIGEAARRQMTALRQAIRGH